MNISTSGLSFYQTPHYQISCRMILCLQNATLNIHCAYSHMDLLQYS